MLDYAFSSRINTGDAADAGAACAQSAAAAADVPPSMIYLFIAHSLAQHTVQPLLPGAPEAAQRSRQLLSRAPATGLLSRSTSASEIMRRYLIALALMALMAASCAAGEPREAEYDR